MIILLYRAKAYKHFRKKDELEIMIGKQRDYEANVTLVGEFYPMVSRIENVRRVTEEQNEEESEPEGDDSVY